MAHASNTPQHISHLPSPPYGRESVLSTRSLSYLSNDAHSSPSMNLVSTPSQNRNAGPSHPRIRPRRNTLNSESDYGLELTETREQELKDIPELPTSVSRSPLFILPREIRDRIYSFCLTSQNGKQVEWPVVYRADSMHPRLLRTCKIIFAEAAPLLYTQNIMTFHHPSDANMFVRAMTSPSQSRHIANLSLHIKAQDTRLWMPYFDTRDPSRNLKLDFPSLKELLVRFRSNKWQHSLPPEANMKVWSEDTRLDEVIDTLRHVFLPHFSNNSNSKLEAALDARLLSSAYPPSFPGDPAFQRQWLEIHKARNAFDYALGSKRDSAPTIKVVCACRVHATHYNALTTGPLPTPPIPIPDHAHANNGAGNNQPQPDDVFAPPVPVQEGSPFRGFTAIDLRSGMKRLHDPELGSANVARTPFADKNGILLSLEIHCLDPKREMPHAAF